MFKAGDRVTFDPTMHPERYDADAYEETGTVEEVVDTILIVITDTGEYREWDADSCRSESRG